MSTMTKTEARKARTKALPWPAKVGAALLLAGLAIGLPVSCSIQGAAYDACIQRIAQTEGHDAAEIAMREGECR